ncbi:MAG: alpha/beta hydrolase [Proteobacteria bacterium]|nr:alpha/beta hydrolase [Cystobacterineae bacterium]MCL2315291.1 alpha/beta hydrolase [Pseudomonadota bacterium]
MNINSLHRLNINNSEQWVLVRGKNNEAPLIVQAQAGPGLPMISEANSMNRLLHWEDDFLVAYWDQRACGKSFNNNIAPESVNIRQMTDDLLSVVEQLLEKYNKENAVLIGYSIGATISLLAASKQGSLFSNLFLVGMDIDVSAANKHILEFARKKAIEKNKPGMLKQIEELEKTPIETDKLFQKRAKIITNLGGMLVKSNYNQLLFSTIKNMLSCKYYSFSDMLRTIKAMSFCQNAILPEMNKLNLFNAKVDINIPVHFMQGLQDAVAPVEIAEKYFNFLSVQDKTMTYFDNSAHMPHLEEPEKFYELIKNQAQKF